MPELRLEPRTQHSTRATFMVSAIAIGLTLIGGSVVFAFYGISPFKGFHALLVEPLTSSYGIGEVLLKMGPLLLIAEDGATVADCTGPRHRLSRAGLEHRRRRSADSRRNRRRHACDRARRQRVALAVAGHGARRRRCRHGLGRHRRLAAHILQRQRDPRDLHALEYRAATALLPRHRAAARPDGLQFSAVDPLLRRRLVRRVARRHPRQHFSADRTC